MMKPIAFVDLEGVLVPEMWPYLAGVAGEDGFMLTTREEPDYQKIMQRRVELLRHHGLGVNAVERIVGNMDLLEGAEAFFLWLSSFAETWIVTDSFRPVNSKLLARFSPDRVLSNSFSTDRQGYAADMVYWHGGHGKIKAFDQADLSGRRILAVGDGLNDLEMLRAAHCGVLLNPSSKTASIASDLIVARSLTDVRDLFLQKIDADACVSMR